MRKDLGVQRRLYHWEHGCNLNSVLYFTAVKTGHWNKEQHWDSRILQNTEQVKYSKDATQVNKMDKPPYQVNLDMIIFTSNLGTFCILSFISFLLSVLISEKKQLEYFQRIYCLNSSWDTIGRNGDPIWPLHPSVLLCWKQCSNRRYSDLFLLSRK